MTVPISKIGNKQDFEQNICSSFIVPDLFFFAYQDVDLKKKKTCEFITFSTDAACTCHASYTYENATHECG